MVIPSEYALVRLHWTADGDPEDMISTIGVDLEIGTATSASALALDVRTAWAAQFVPSSLSNLHRFMGASVTMGPSPGDGAIGEDFAPVRGTATAPHLPTNCALLIAKSSGVGGRRNRGRMYLPAGHLGEENVDHNGIINSALFNATQTRVTAFLAALKALPTVTDAVVFHSASATGSAIPPPTVITSLVVRPKIATQRRRMR